SPQTSGSKFGKNEPLALYLFSIRQLPGSCPGRQIRRERLLKSAVCHTTFLQERLLYQLRKGLPGHIHHQLLQDDIAAAGVTKPRAGLHVDPNGTGISRLLSFQYLRQGRQCFVHSVTEKSRLCYAGSVRQQTTKSYLLLFCKLVLRVFPSDVALVP